jgi:DNA replication regulator SLD2
MSLRKIRWNKERNAIGPTPQKNGQVLGLFDLMPDTPSTNRNEHPTGLIMRTPSKRTPSQTMGIGDILASGGRASRTPTSSSKRNYLNSFMTPLKRKRDDGNENRTPTSVSKLHFSTPSFLRRDSQRTEQHVDESGDPVFASPILRIPVKPGARGLSNIIAGLRRIEEEAHEDEEEALREMEGEADPKPRPTVPKVTFATDIPEPQPPQPEDAFGPDEFFAGVGEDPSSEDEKSRKAGLGRDGQPLRVWKKKGQKRTTKRVKSKFLVNAIYQVQITNRPKCVLLFIELHLER